MLWESGPRCGPGLDAFVCPMLYVYSTVFTFHELPVDSVCTSFKWTLWERSLLNCSFLCSCAHVTEDLTARIAGEARLAGARRAERPAAFAPEWPIPPFAYTHCARKPALWHRRPADLQSSLPFPLLTAYVSNTTIQYTQYTNGTLYSYVCTHTRTSINCIRNSSVFSRVFRFFNKTCKQSTHLH